MHNQNLTVFEAMMSRIFSSTKLHGRQSQFMFFADRKVPRNNNKLKTRNTEKDEDRLRITNSKNDCIVHDKALSSLQGSQEHSDPKDYREGTGLKDFQGNGD